jgi:hypothetical protein
MPDARLAALLLSACTVLASLLAGCTASPSAGPAAAATSGPGGPADAGGNAAAPAGGGEAGGAGSSTPGGSGDGGPAPPLQVGDSWTMNATMDYAGSVIVYTQTSRVAALEPHTIPSGTYDSIRLETHGVARDSHTNITQWRRASDWAILATRTVTYRVSSHGTTRPTGILQVMDSPCLGYRWPLTVGQSWTTSCTGQRYSANSNPANGGGKPFTQNETRTVEDEGPVSVPAGTFDAFRMQVSTSLDGQTPATSQDWFSEGACSSVRVLATASSLGPVELQSYHCTPQ